MDPSYGKGVFYCLVATLAWGSMFPLMTDGLAHLDPFTFTSLRYGLACVPFLILLIAREGIGALNLRGERVWLAWLLGSLGFAGFGFLVFLGQSLAGPGGALTASITMATMPMLGALVNWMLRKVAPAPVSLGLIAVSFLGVALVITEGDLHQLIGAPQDHLANLAILAGALCWVIYTVGAAYFPGWSPQRYTAITTLLGLTSVFAINAALYASGFLAVPSLAQMTTVAPHVVYMALIPGFVGVLAWNMGNKILTPLNGVLFMDVVPLTTFGLSAILGERPSSPQLLGAALAGAALILNNLYLRNRAAAQRQALASIPGRA